MCRSYFICDEISGDHCHKMPHCLLWCKISCLPNIIVAFMRVAYNIYEHGRHKTTNNGQWTGAWISNVLVVWKAEARGILGEQHQTLDLHYTEIIMSAMASQITSVWTGCSGEDQSFTSLAFVRGIHQSLGASNAENVSIWWRHHAYVCNSQVTLIWWQGTRI